MLQLRKPYLIFLGEVTNPADAKTGFGLRDWCPGDVIGECALPGASVSLGLPRLSPRDAAERGAGSIVIGVAPAGGQLADAWVPVLVQALEAGLDVVSGLHTRLESRPELLRAASPVGASIAAPAASTAPTAPAAGSATPAAAASGDGTGARLINVRHLPLSPPIASGARRSGRRVLTVGTDCALGKKYTALALARELQGRGVRATFRATGQTGIMIAGSGVPIDAVVADFIAGAAEMLSPANHPDHWDVVEGQGALFHPAYAGVTLGLIHGSQPDALVLCHDPSRRETDGHPGYRLPPLAVAIERYLDAARLTNPAARCIGVAINSSSLDDAAWARWRDAVSAELGAPVCDPMRGGVAALADALLRLPVLTSEDRLSGRPAEASDDRAGSARAAAA